MTHPVQPDLIFDLGAHQGLDTEFYAKKGFRVIALEASPDLCEQVATLTSTESDRVTLVNKALDTEAGRTVPFFTVPGKDDWGSLSRAHAEKGVETAVEVQVSTINLQELIDDYGTPYYIKCDLEGGDLIFLDQLLAESRRPTFVSVEMNEGTEGATLARCGYEVAQLVNQWLHPFRSPPNPACEGDFVERTFTGHTSGLFGRELDRSKWIPVDEIDAIYAKWRALRAIDVDLVPGWLDLHATTRNALEAEHVPFRADPEPEPEHEPGDASSTSPASD